MGVPHQWCTPPGQDPGSANLGQGHMLHYHRPKIVQVGPLPAPIIVCHPKKGLEALQEIHEGICGNHVSMANKVVRRRYFWPTMNTDAKHLAMSCGPCQLFANIPYQPPERLITMTSPWPFAQWGLDLIGHIPKGKGHTSYAL